MSLERAVEAGAVLHVARDWPDGYVGDEPRRIERRTRSPETERLAQDLAAAKMLQDRLHRRGWNSIPARRTRRAAPDRLGAERADHLPVAVTIAPAGADILRALAGRARAPPTAPPQGSPR